MPKFSVIIPVYNTEKYLKKCIDSVLKQTLQDYEIIVVNDGTLGNCDGIISSYSKTCIQYVKLPNNMGTHIAREKGVEIAKGDYICFIDADDFLLHNTVLEDLAPKIQDADILSYNFELVYPDGARIPCPTSDNATKDKILTSQEEIYWELFNGGMSDGQPVKITKKTLWQECVPYFPKDHLVFMEDYLISVILLYFAKKVITTSYYGYGYYQPYKSATKFYNMNQAQVIKTLKDFSLVNDRLDEFFKNNNIYKKYKKNILDKRRLVMNAITGNISYSMFSNPVLKEEASKAFKPWFIYKKIKEEIKNRIDIKPSCKISIVMPVFNTEPYLKRCIDSILNQSFTDYEIIVVDDDSPGNCQEIVSGYNNQHLYYYRNPENMGSAWSRMHGLSKANGEYIYFMDSDDWLVEESLEKMFNHVSRGGYDVLYFHEYFSTEEKYWVDVDDNVQNYIIKGHPKVFDNFFVKNIERKSLWCRLFRREIISKGALHMPNEWISVADDWLLNIFALWYSKSMKAVDEYYYYYYQENPNAISNHVERRIANRAVSPEKANNYMRQVDAVFSSLEHFLLNQGIMEKYRNSWNFYQQDYKYYHMRQMIEGVEQYFLEEIDENPGNALKELRNMTHNRLSTINVFNKCMGSYQISGKETVKIIINKIKARNRLVGLVIENSLLTMWRFYKKIKH